MGMGIPKDKLLKAADRAASLEAAPLVAVWPAEPRASRCMEEGWKAARLVASISKSFAVWR